MNTEATVQRIALKAVIVKDGKVLTLREASTYKDGNNVGRYHLPGGRLEMGEPFTDGLRREVREETGLEVEIGEPLYVGEWFPNIRGVQNQIVAIFFVCKPVEPDVAIVLSEEHDDFRWVNLEEVRELDVMPPENEVLETYYQKYQDA